MHLGILFHLAHPSTSVVVDGQCYTLSIQVFPRIRTSTALTLFLLHIQDLLPEREIHFTAMLMVALRVLPFDLQSLIQPASWISRKILKRFPDGRNRVQCVQHRILFSSAQAIPNPHHFYAKCRSSVHGLFLPYWKRMQRSKSKLA